MNKPIILRPRADADLDAIFSYLHQRSPEAARKFLDAVESAFELLAGQPAIGSMRHAEYFDDLPHPLRFHPINGFDRVLIYYMDRPDHVDVLRIWDAARGLDALTENLES